MKQTLIRGDEISLEKLKEMLHYDFQTGLFTWKKIHAPRMRIGDLAGCRRASGYIQICLLGRYYLAHRLAWFYVNGKWPEAEIDHCDRNSSNNKIENLREVSRAENNRNRQHEAYGYSKEGKSNTWPVRISFAGKRYFLGYFQNEDEAKEVFTDAKEAVSKAIEQFCGSRKKYVIQQTLDM